MPVMRMMTAFGGEEESGRCHNRGSMFNERQTTTAIPAILHSLCEHAVAEDIVVTILDLSGVVTNVGSHWYILTQSWLLVLVYHSTAPPPRSIKPTDSKQNIWLAVRLHKYH